MKGFLIELTIYSTNLSVSDLTLISPDIRAFERGYGMIDIEWIVRVEDLQAACDFAIAGLFNYCIVPYGNKVETAWIEAVYTRNQNQSYWDKLEWLQIVPDSIHWEEKWEEK